MSSVQGSQHLHHHVDGPIEGQRAVLDHGGRQALTLDELHDRVYPELGRVSDVEQLGDVLVADPSYRPHLLKKSLLELAAAQPTVKKAHGDSTTGQQVLGFEYLPDGALP
jgi:hypothetical protein